MRSIHALSGARSRLDEKYSGSGCPHAALLPKERPSTRRTMADETEKTHEEEMRAKLAEAALKEG